MKVDFGVVNYNGGQEVLQCVESILAQDAVDARVWVLDNASTDESARAVEERFPSVQVVRSARNLGYAGALNRLAERMDGDVLVLCNMDLRFVPSWAGTVVAALDAQPAVDAVASVVVEMTEPPVLNSLGVRFYPDLHAQNDGSGEPYEPERVEQQSREAFGAYGAVMCFRRQALEDIRFDESYFLFFEETDFFLRFHLLGRRTVLVPGALVYHQRSHSTRRYSTLKLYYGERNRLTTVFKLLPVWYWPVSLWHSVGRYLRLARTVDRAAPAQGGAMPPKHVIVRTILKAWSAAVLRLPSTLRARRRFWKRAPARPRQVLALIRQYRLPASRLTIR
jgi:GT2 family glycosyltransferase